jgi:hypothetical protein
MAERLLFCGGSHQSSGCRSQSVSRRFVKETTARAFHRLRTAINRTTSKLRLKQPHINCRRRSAGLIQDQHCRNISCNVLPCRRRAELASRFVRATEDSGSHSEARLTIRFLTSHSQMASHQLFARKLWQVLEAGRGWNEIVDCPHGPALGLRIRLNLPSRRYVSVRRYRKLNVICMSLFGATRVDILIASTHIILASDRCILIGKQAPQPLAASSPDVQR